MPWRSAELVLFDDDPYAPPAFPFWIEPVNTGGKRTTTERKDSGSKNRSGVAAFYRHQQTTECDCASCRKDRLRKREAPQVNLVVSEAAHQTS